MIKRTGNKLRIGRLLVRAERWPWQGYGWGGRSSKLNAHLNDGARFGGGWKYKLGVSIGSTTVMVDLLFGYLCFTWENGDVRTESSSRA